MKKIIVFLIAILSITNGWSQNQKVNWNGTFIAEDCWDSPLGDTGMFPCYNYKLTIKPTNVPNVYSCLVSLNGYMLESQISAEAVSVGNTLSFKFIKCIAAGDDFGLRKGDCFLKLERRGAKIITRKASFHYKDDWNNRLPVFKKCKTNKL